MEKFNSELLVDTFRFRPIDSADFNLEQSLNKNTAIAAVQVLFPDNAEGATKYFRDRGPAIDELFGGRVSYQVGPVKKGDVVSLRD